MKKISIIILSFCLLLCCKENKKSIAEIVNNNNFKHKLELFYQSKMQKSNKERLYENVENYIVYEFVNGSISISNYRDYYSDLAEPKLTYKSRKIHQIRFIAYDCSINILDTTVVTNKYSINIRCILKPKNMNKCNEPLMEDSHYFIDNNPEEKAINLMKELINLLG